MAFKYYTLENIRKIDADFYIVFGKKGPGKTTALLVETIKNYVNTGYKKQCVWLRRYKDDYGGGNAEKYYSDLVARNVVSELTNGKWDGVYYFRRAWYLTRLDNNGDIVKDSTPFCHAYAITDYQKNNGAQYPDANMMVFDEFVTEHELTNEFSLFTKCYSNIRRQKKDFTCYLLGNTVSYFSTYWDAMGIGELVRNMKVNTIEVVHGKWKGRPVTLACEFTGMDNPDDPDEVSEAEVPIKYFEQFNSELAMITTGEWEVANYENPPEYNNWDRKYRCYLQFYEYLFAIDLIKDHNKDIYLSIHPHTGEIPPKSIIYNPDSVPDRYHKCNIMLADTKIEKIIKDLIIHKKVFYANNLCGNIFDAYLEKC